MPQVLKDESRIAIIEAAKEEFLQKGYKGASMRHIAAKANMTVGNLYRYFKNKEAINLSILDNISTDFDNVIKIISINNISMETRVYNVKPNINELKTLFDKFADSFVDLYFLHKVEFNILLTQNTYKDQLLSNFSYIINSMIANAFVLKDLSKDKDVLVKTYADAMYNGLVTMFREEDCEIGVLKILLKTYLKSYLFMFDNDIRKYAI